MEDQLLSILLQQNILLLEANRELIKTVNLTLSKIPTLGSPSGAPDNDGEYVSAFDNEHNVIESDGGVVYLPSLTVEDIARLEMEELGQVDGTDESYDTVN